MKNAKGFIVPKNTPTSYPLDPAIKNTPSKSHGMGQTKTMSMTESLFNILLGFWIAVLAQVIIFPWFDIAVPIDQNVYIAMCFTVVSFVRSYAVRRVFNALQARG